MRKKRTVFRRVWWLALGRPLLEATLAAVVINSLAALLFHHWNWPWLFGLNVFPVCWLSGHYLLWRSNTFTIDSANKRLVCRQGMLGLCRDHIPLNFAPTVLVRQSQWGRWCNFGDVEVIASGRSVQLVQIGWLDALEIAINSQGQELLEERPPLLLNALHVLASGLYMLLRCATEILVLLLGRVVPAMIYATRPLIRRLAQVVTAVPPDTRATSAPARERPVESSVKMRPSYKILRSDFIDCLERYMLNGHQVLPIDEMLASFPATWLYLDVLSDNNIVFPIRMNGRVDWRVLPHIQSIEDVLRRIPPDVFVDELPLTARAASIHPVNPARKQHKRPNRAMAA